MLTTNGIQTFAIFRYKTLEWHTSSVGRGPATAGVNAGDFLNGFSLRDPKDILNLVSMSNVGVRGLFVYRLDLGPSKLFVKLTVVYTIIILSIMLCRFSNKQYSHG